MFFFNWILRDFNWVRRQLGKETVEGVKREGEIRGTEQSIKIKNEKKTKKKDTRRDSAGGEKVSAVSTRNRRRGGSERPFRIPLIGPLILLVRLGASLLHSPRPPNWIVSGLRIFIELNLVWTGLNWVVPRFSRLLFAFSLALSGNTEFHWAPLCVLFLLSSTGSCESGRISQRTSSGQRAIKSRLGRSTEWRVFHDSAPMSIDHGI